MVSPSSFVSTSLFPREKTKTKKQKIIINGKHKLTQQCKREKKGFLSKYIKKNIKVEIQKGF